MNSENRYSMNDIAPLIIEAVSHGSTAKLAVRGNSMVPFLTNERDFAVFSALPQRKIRRGDIILFLRNDGRYVMHRVFAVEKDNSLTMLGDAQTMLEAGILPEQVFAYVGSVIRKGKEISCERGFWRRAMTAYMLIRIHLPHITRVFYSLIYHIRIIFNKNKGGQPK